VVRRFCRRGEAKSSIDFLLEGRWSVMVNDLESLRWTCERALNWHGNRSAAELLAEIPSDLGIDRYGAGGAVAALEEEVRVVLGKPAVVFMPSGTMAQQIAIRVHADKRGVRAFGFHPTAHLELHEDKAYQRVHGLVGVPIGDARRLLTIEDLSGLHEPLAAVLFELPQREIGGRLPEWEDLEQQVAFVRERGAAVHLDGARIWECTPYYGKAPADIAALFDTVYVSLYKGLGGLAGCCLAGDEEVIEQARAWRTRHGGTLFALWPYAASGLAALRKRLPMMPRYYEHARAIADALRANEKIEIVPDPPQTPMMHLHMRVEEEAFLDAARRLATEQGLFTWPGTSPSGTPSVRVAELTVGDATLTFAPSEVAKILEQLT
jgi:threonine aldolase